MIKKIFLLIVFFLNIVLIYSQNNINNILNKEIVIKHGFAGESLKLVFEENNYYIYRDILGSGLPSIGIIKYNVILNSEYKITFSEIITISENIRDIYNSHDIFEIYFRDKIEIFLNGEKIDIYYIR